MQKTINAKSLAISNLSRKAYRTLSLTVLIALSSAVLFGSLVLSSSLKAGIGGLRSRLGADLLVVPEGYEKGAENILLSGEPNYFYMERSILDSVRSVSGVEKASPQFFLTSLSESCCDFPVQIIGFEPESDFVVQNWARNRIKKNLPDEEFLFSGCNVNVNKKTVKFFGESHKISGTLSKSGTGMDSVIFCDMESIQKIFDSARKKGYGFLFEGDTKSKISTILVKLSPNVTADSVALKIKSAVSGVQVIQGEQFIRNFSGKISVLLVFFYSISVLVLLITIFSLAIVFSITTNERRREFSILRVLGADRSVLRSILFYEAAFLGFSGSFLGIGVASLVILPFNALISEKISLPFAMSSVVEILIFAAAVFVINALSCVVSAINGAVRISKVEPYGDVK